MGRVGARLQAFLEDFIAPGLPVRVDQAVNALATRAPPPPPTQGGGAGLIYRTMRSEEDDRAELVLWR